MYFILILINLYISFFFDQNADQPAIEDLLRNCSMCKDELLIGGNLEDAFVEYEHLLKIARETGCPVNRALLNNSLFFFCCCVKGLYKNVTLL